MRNTESSYIITRVISNAPRKPVDQITDRAKRYRAQQDVQGPRRCVLCNGKSDLQVMHLSGDESDGEKRNLAYGCRSCNGKLSAAFKKIGAGVKTRQYNPASGVPTYEQYKWAVSHGSRHYWEKGEGWVPGEHDDAGSIRPPAVYRPTCRKLSAALQATIHATPRAKRIEYAKRIAAGRGRRKRTSVPF